jgi:modulator of FtsH protease
MGHAYVTTGWENFFFAEVGASAALVGLLFVAVSINLAKILAIPFLPGRAFEALVVLFMVLLISTFALVPGQSTTALGIEIASSGFFGWAMTLYVQSRFRTHASHKAMWLVTRVIATQLATVPMMIAGGSLLAQRGGGLYWTVAGVVATFFAALIDAWVLLVEIHR